MKVNLATVFASETPQSPPRRQHAEETVRWVDRVTCSPGGLAGVVNV